VGGFCGIAGRPVGKAPPEPSKRRKSAPFAHRKGEGGVPYRPAFDPVRAPGTRQRPVLGRPGAVSTRRAEPHRREGDRSWARISSPISVAAVARMVADLNTPAYGGAVPLPHGRGLRHVAALTAAAPTVPCRHPRDRSPPSRDGGERPDQLGCVKPGKINERLFLRHPGLAHAVHDALVLLQVGRIIALRGEIETADGERGIKRQSGVGFSLRLP
jgi:hypothetical protein